MNTHNGATMRNAVERKTVKEAAEHLRVPVGASRLTGRGGRATIVVHCYLNATGGNPHPRAPGAATPGAYLRQPKVP